MSPQDGQALDGCSAVLRVASADNMDADMCRVSPEAFQMGSDEEKDKVFTPHLSVYETTLTTPKQAALLMGYQDDDFLVCALRVEEVRLLRPSPDENPQFPLLDVQWFRALIKVDDVEVQDQRPGAEGHCGIVGTNWGSDGKKAKALRRSIRSQLTDLAQKDIRLANIRTLRAASEVLNLM
jgi:hypothetical protein